MAGVAAWLTSLIAVIGTLLGSTITYLFQRSHAGRAEAVARSERLRQDRIVAYSEFAGTITELRRGVITLWFHRLRQSDLADPELLADSMSRCNGGLS
jgi:membrane protein YqaA with SNARE-associated domain